MIQLAFILSLIITGIYVCLQQGMILGWLRILGANLCDRYLDKNWSRYVQKPLWDCLACMSAIWTILITWSFDPMLILAVCGLNAIIDKLLDYETKTCG